MNTYFLLYTYVHINCSLKRALIINTETNKIVVTNNIHFISAYNELKQPTTHYMIKVNKNALEDLDFMKLLDKMEIEHFGEYIYTKEENKPIQFSPQIKINNKDPEIRNNLPNNSKERNKFKIAISDEIGNNILDNIFEISIYYSSLPEKLSASKVDVNKQYMYPIKSSSNTKFQEFELLFNPQYSYNRLIEVNIIAGILNNNDIQYLENNIKKYFSNKIVNLFIPWTIYNQSKENLKSIVCLCKTIYVWHDGLLPSNLYPKLYSNQKNLYLIDNEKDILELESEEIDSICPLYNGENKKFIMSYLKFSEKDILEQKYTEQEIIVNKYINRNFFGELSIFPNGDVYSCKNMKPLGNIKTHDIKYLTFEEMYNQRNWFLTRSNMHTCNNCVLNWLCPPVTNNELAIGYWTFCTKYR